MSKLLTIFQGLATIEEQTAPGQLESDKDRLLLIQDKEQLVRELRSIAPNSRPEREMRMIQKEIEKLERDLNNALEISNRCIADRYCNKYHPRGYFLLLEKIRIWHEGFRGLLEVISMGLNLEIPSREE